MDPPVASPRVGKDVKIQVEGGSHWKSTRPKMVLIGWFTSFGFVCSIKENIIIQKGTAIFEIVATNPFPH